MNHLQAAHEVGIYFINYDRIVYSDSILSINPSNPNIVRQLCQILNFFLYINSLFILIC
jgi:hypothetical protein